MELWVPTPQFGITSRGEEVLVRVSVPDMLEQAHSSGNTQEPSHKVEA